MKQLTVQLKRYQYLLISAAIILLLGYTAYEISQVLTVQADKRYQSAQEQQLKTTQIKISQETINAIKNLDHPTNTDIPIHTGKADPFSP